MIFFCFISYNFLGDIMLRKVYEYVRDDEFRFTIFKDRIHIVNYHRIKSLNSDLVLFSDNDREFSIKGKNLILNKLLDNEVLILGEVYKIEVINE